jgi:hypothetical protein
MVSSFTPRSISSSTLFLYTIILCPSLSPKPILKIEHGYDQSSVTSFIPSSVPIVDPSTVPSLEPSLKSTDTNAEPSYVSILRNHIWCFFTSSFCHSLRLLVGADIFILLYVDTFYEDNGKIHILFPSLRRYVLYIKGLLSISSRVSILRNFTSSLCPNRRLPVGADIFILLYVDPFYGDNDKLNTIFPSMNRYVLYIEGLLSTSSQLSALPYILKSSHQSILLVVMILPWNLASRGCVSIWISASYLEFIPIIPMKDMPPFMKDIPLFLTLFPVIHCFKWD